MKQDLLQQLHEEGLQKEKRNKQVSFAATLGICAILLFFSMFWMALQGTIPPVDEPQWQTVGMADFGNMIEGSKNINNLEDPSRTPADKPAGEVKPAVTETRPMPSESKPVENMASNTESEHSVVENTDPTPNPDVNATQVNTQENANETSETTNDSPNETDANSNFEMGGGSNDGEKGDQGNNGSPDAQVLNPGGNFAFGDGIGGPSGRKPLKLVYPEYSVQKEAKITFSFVIAPTGEVVYVEPEFTTHTKLAALGADAIRKWRFSEAPGSEPLQTTVTITFKLK